MQEITLDYGDIFFDARASSEDPDESDREDRSGDEVAVDARAASADSDYTAEDDRPDGADGRSDVEKEGSDGEEARSAGREDDDRSDGDLKCLCRVHGRRGGRPVAAGQFGLVDIPRGSPLFLARQWRQPVLPGAPSLYGWSAAGWPALKPSITRKSAALGQMLDALGGDEAAFLAHLGRMALEPAYEYARDFVRKKPGPKNKRRRPTAPRKPSASVPAHKRGPKRKDTPAPRR